MKENISCFYLRNLLNAYLLINGVFILKYTPVLQGTSWAQKLGRMYIRLAIEKCNFPLDSPHRQKKIRDFMQRKTLYCIIFMSYKTYGIFMINTQYVNCRHQRLRMQMTFAKIQCRLLQLHVTCICLCDIWNVSDINKVFSKSNCRNMPKLTLYIGKTSWNPDICRKINLHAKFLWLRMIRTVNNFFTAQWVFFNCQ